MTKCHIIRSSVAIEETFRDGALAGSDFDGWAATRSDSYFSSAPGGRDTEEMLSSMSVLCGHAVSPAVISSAFGSHTAFACKNCLSLVSRAFAAWPSENEAKL